ncbi:hypothetical protein Trco_006112 [Trichoderma cornu-damae]|uniref:Uncharacterized protein n=1 Tax=Trichoderma cornu-damae TaxID=654480 RepID=A0A9P8QKR6_9HYPO|nr:hypothetical protein Trco_006112 [Trichoderma cornu-damae]
MGQGTYCVLAREIFETAINSSAEARVKPRSGRGQSGMFRNDGNGQRHGHLHGPNGSRFGKQHFAYVEAKIGQMRGPLPKVHKFSKQG